MDAKLTAEGWRRRRLRMKREDAKWAKKASEVKVYWVEPRTLADGFAEAAAHKDRHKALAEDLRKKREGSS